MRTKLVRELAHEHRDGRLRSAVMRMAADAVVVQRRDEDDVSLPAGADERVDEPPREEPRSAQVRPEHVVEVLLAKVEEPVDGRYARVVDDQLRHAEPLEHGGGEGGGIA